MRLDAIIGRGGMSTVWRGRDIAMDRPVAVKVLSADFASSAADREQFFNEARVMTRVQHPGIVHAYDLNCANGLYYIVMELVEGYTFAQRVSQKGPIPEEDALIIAESVSVALGHAWNQYRVVHCDIKPENLMIHSDGTVKVADLGLCRSRGMHSGAMREDEVIGTPGYISPEQVYGDVALDARADIYSLGASLYQLTTGHMLFEGRSNDDMLRAHVDASQAVDPRLYAERLSGPFAALLAHMTVKDRDQRYADWDAVLKDVGLVAAGRFPSPVPAAAVSSIRLQSDARQAPPPPPAASSRVRTLKTHKRSGPVLTIRRK